MYPFDYRPKGGFVDQRKIFVAMPFADEYEKIYTNLILPALEMANESRDPSETLTPYRAKDPKHTRTGWLDILENLFTARLVLGVLTGDNPNVFYELGIAHATQQIERQILIAEKEYKVKFDIKDIIHCRYDPLNLSASVAELSDAIADTIRYYDLVNDRLVSQAAAKISRYELWVLNNLGQKSHFVIPELMSDRVFNAIAHLCHQGFLRLSTEHRDAGTINFSYYFTDLGNAVLQQQIGVIDEGERLERSRSYWEHFDI